MTNFNKHAGLDAGTGKVEKRNIPFAAPTFNHMTDYGGAMTVDSVTEEVTLSTGGATTDTTANVLPANSVILAVYARVTETFGTAASYTLGDATTAARFLASTSDVTAGDTAVGLAHREGGVSTDATGPTQASAAALRITANATPSAGKLLITVVYEKHTAPTESPAS